MDYNKVVILTHQEVISQTMETERVVWMQLAHIRTNREHKVETTEKDLKVNCIKKTPT